MTAIVTFQMKTPTGSVPAYLADGSGEPILFAEASKASAWASMNKALFERAAGEVILRGRFGMLSAGSEMDVLDMLTKQPDRVPCFPLDQSLIQDADDESLLVGDTGSVSLVPDMDAYAARLAMPAAQRW